MILKTMKPAKLFYFAGWIIMFLLIYVKYVMYIDLPRSILLVLYIVMAIFSNKEELIGLCLCTIPLSTSFHFYYAIIVCIFVYIFRYSAQIKVNNAFFVIVILWMWELLHCFGNGYSINSSLTFIFSYILAFLLMYSCCREINYEYIVRLLAICTSFMCFVVLSKLMQDSGWSISNAFRGMQRLGTIDGIEEVGAYFNPNTLGYFCIMASCGLIQNVMIGKFKSIDILLIIFLIICGFLTTSKTFIVCLLLMIFLFVVSISGGVASKIKNLILLIVVCSIILVSLDLFFEVVLENYIVRFGVKDISSGRVRLFNQYNDYILSSAKAIFWGTGLSAQRAVIDKYFGVSNFEVPHNGFQEIIVVWGVPGLILFFVFLYVMIVRAKKHSNVKGLINYIPLILLLVKVQVGQLITSFPTMLTFSLAYLSMCADFDNKNERIQHLIDKKGRIGNFVKKDNCSNKKS